MIRVSVVYASGPGTKFDWDYYMGKHIPAVKKLTPMGLVRVEVDKGMAGAQPGAPAPFLCMAHLHFNNMNDMQKCMAGSGELMADVPNFTNVQPQIQISEILS